MTSFGCAYGGKTETHTTSKSWTTTRRRNGLAGKTLGPVPPGEILSEEFLTPLGISSHALAKALRLPPKRITGTVNGERAIAAETALRLSRYFGTSPDFWLN